MTDNEKIIALTNVIEIAARAISEAVDILNESLKKMSTMLEEIK